MTGDAIPLTSLPIRPAGEPPPLLRGQAKATDYFGRLLDALVVLDAEKECRIDDLAAQVGLEPDKLRELISAYMVAGAEVLGGGAPFNVTFGPAHLGTGEEDDAAFATAEVVRLDSSRGRGSWLLGDLGRRPVMVKDVARAVLAGALLLETADLPEERRTAVQALVGKLSEALGGTVKAPAEAVAPVLHQAALDRRRVRFRYLHPWTGESVRCEADPYDVRRQRDRLVLDAGPELVTYDLDGISELEVLDASFEVPDLPAREDRYRGVEVVLRVTDQVAERWLLEGWGGTVVGPVPGGVDVRVLVDEPVGEEGVAARLGALLVQLGPGVRVVSPERLRTAAVPVAQRLLQLHPPR